MSGISVDSDWTTLLAGFIVGGIGIGLVNAPLATTAVSTVRQERAGMASGLNNTFRQLGIATGIAALGAIFQGKVGGNTFGDSGHLSEAAKSAFVAGLNSILEVGAVVAAIGAVLAVLLVRGKDFVASGPPPTIDA
jgi:predicted MFS family arabinose efflux permease